jgi:hypothetical protein
MNVHILTNKKQALAFCESIMQARLPLKVATQPIYPLRTLESNAYLWGIVYETIAQSTGQSSIEVHRGYKKLFNFRYDLLYNNSKRQWMWKIGTGSTTILDMVEIWEYIMKVRADAEIELGVTIQMPSEVFINELKFDIEV